MPITIKAQADEADKHTNDVTALLLHKEKLYSASDDGKIMYWDFDLKKLGEVTAHEASVFSITADEETLYSCSNDGTVKSWTLDLQEKETIIEEQVEFWKVNYQNGILYIGDESGILITYENGEKKGTYELMEGFKDMAVKNDLIYSGKNSGILITEIRDNKRFTTKMTLDGRAPLCVFDSKIVITGRSGKDIIMHENDPTIHFKRVFEKKNAHDMIINTIAALKKGEDIYFYTGGWDNVLKEWKVKGTTLDAGAKCSLDVIVNALVATEDGTIYIGGSDGHIIKVTT